jgi:hypothetical protein
VDELDAFEDGPAPYVEATDTLDETTLLVVDTLDEPLELDEPTALDDPDDAVDALDPVPPAPPSLVLSPQAGAAMATVSPSRMAAAVRADVPVRATRSCPHSGQICSFFAI